MYEGIFEDILQRYYQKLDDIMPYSQSDAMNRRIIGARVVGGKSRELILTRRYVKARIYQN